ncbi:MAG: tRNA (guanosine(37)-N1)-methyltransferase TrmD [Acidimicrobiia bacterium]
MFEIDVFTLFPKYIDDPCSLALLGKAQEKNLVKISSHDIRDYSKDKHKTVDDKPYGGGPGMVMMPEPIFDAVNDVKPKRPLYLLSASGKKFDQVFAQDLAKGEGFSLICGRYEGVDQRVADYLCDGEISIGDYVLAGGESAALIIIEAVTRLIPGVMGNDDSGASESFAQDEDGKFLIEAPQYTRPADFDGLKVPDVLLSGNHTDIDKWRIEQGNIRKNNRNRE